MSGLADTTVRTLSVMQAGCWGVEALGFGTWQDAPLKALGGNETYFGKEIPIPLPALAGIEFFVMAYIESARSSETDRTKRMYPGGSFDPAGFAKVSNVDKQGRGRGG